MPHSAKITFLDTLNKSFDKTYKIIKALSEAVLSAGGNEEDVLRIHTNNDLQAELATVVVKYAQRAAVFGEETFSDLLIGGCRQGKIHPDFIEKHWPLEPITPDEAEWMVSVHHFMKEKTIRENLCNLEEMAARGEIRLLTGSRRAMKWIAGHLCVQHKHSIILPICGEGDGVRGMVPIFRGYYGFRSAGQETALLNLDDKVPAEACWLVLKKTDIVKKGTFDDILAFSELHCISEFTEERWPLGPDWPNTDEWYADEYYFKDRVTFKEGLRRLEEMAARGEIRLLTGSRMMLEGRWGDWPIILPIRAQTNDGSWVVPVFNFIHDRGSTDRDLTLQKIDEMVPGSNSWAIFRKRGKK